MSVPEGINVDPALLDLFRAELDAHIPVLSDGLLALEKGRADESEIAQMMRAAHSIKGAARIVGIDAAVRVAHVMEDCFTAAKDQRIPLTSTAVDVLLQGVDALQRICLSQFDPVTNEAWLESLLGRIAAVRDGQTATLEPQAATATLPAALGRAEPAAAELRLTLPAEFGDAAAERLRVQLCEALRQGTLQFRLDFAQVDRVSAGALSLLASFAGEIARMAPTPALSAVGAAGPLAGLLRVTGLDHAWSSGG